MKGWRPSANKGSKPDRALLKADAFLPDIGSIGLSFHGVLGPRAHDPGIAPWTLGFPFSRHKARGREVGRKWRQASHKDAVRDPKWRQPFTCSGRPEDPETKTRRNDKQPEANRRRLRCGGAFEAGSGAKRKRRRNSQARGRGNATHLILSHDAKHRVSKGGPEGGAVRGLWSVLRDAPPSATHLRTRR
jgi:hypothetical protein